MDSIEDILRFHRPLSEQAFKEEVNRLRERTRDPNFLFASKPADPPDPGKAMSCPPPSSRS
ncbi:hypothetical protein BH23GEM4_BH23GEM4_11530 [soil metagenome]